MENLEENNKEKKIPAESGSLGKANTRDPNAPLEDFHLSKEALQARQAAIGEKRKYFGPTSKESEEESNSLTGGNDTDVPQTDCKEPPGTQE